MLPNASTSILCLSNIHGEIQNCSTNSSCYYYATVDAENKLSDEQYGCTGGHEATDYCHHLHENLKNLQKCCKINYCNKKLREEALIYVKSLNLNEPKINNNIWLVMLLGVFVIVVAFLAFFIWKFHCRHHETSNEEDLKAPCENVEMQPQLNRRTAGMDLQLKFKIGEGSFGRVFVASYKGDEVAVKVFEPEHLQSFYLEKSIYEFGAMKNDFVLKCIFSDMKMINEISRYVLVTEYCPSGSLRSLLVRETIDIDLCIAMSNDIASGLAYLHREIVVSAFNNGKPSIAHRDLKSTNIFLKRNFKCVIGDFGYSILNKTKIDFGNESGFDSESSSMSIVSSCPGLNSKQILVGTLRYLAPEILCGAINKDNFDAFRQSDMYSFGLVLWEIGTRAVVKERVSTYQLPYYQFCADPSPSVQKMIEITSMVRPEIPAYWSKSQKMIAFRKIIEECWSAHAVNRLTALNCQFKLKALLSDGYNSS